MTCEDYPCCGHDICPDFDPDTGKQLNMRCTCGAEVPLSSPSSLCPSCLRGPSSSGHDDYYDEPYDAYDAVGFDDYDDDGD